MQSKDVVLIAVMGPTGAGKTSFINTVSGSDLAVGYGLKSKTAQVAASPQFELYGRRVTLIDTPGFDDTLLSDIDVLKMIALFLQTSYEHDCKLNGIIYMHPISDFRYGGVAKKNFNMFRQLCGEKSLRSVVITTSKWAEVAPGLAAARERQLQEDPDMFKHAIDAGAHFMPYLGNRYSGQEVIKYLADNKQTTLRIQEELVDKKMDISDTSAANELHKEMAVMMRKYREELEGLRKEIKAALKHNMEEARKDFEDQRRELEAKAVKAEEERKKLSEEYARQKQETDEKLKEAVDALKERDGKEGPVGFQEILVKVQELAEEKANLAREKDDLAKEKEQWTQQQTDGKKPDYVAIVGQVVAVVAQIVLAALGGV